MKVIAEWAGLCQGAVKGLGWLVFGPLTAGEGRAGAFQSSIRSRWADQSVVRGVGGSIKWAAVRLVEARHRSEFARACAGWRGEGIPGRGAPKWPTTLG
jgi:hypothetical protein